MNSITIEKIKRIIIKTKDLDSNKVIASFIIANLEKFASFNITTLAINTNTSTTSVIRFCKFLNFTGFKDFKFTLLTEIENNKKKYHTTKNDYYDNDFYEIEKNIDYFKQEKQLFLIIANLLISSKENFLFAFGGNANIAKIFHNYLIRFRVNSIYLTDRDDQLAYSHNINEESTCVFISYKFRDSRWQKVFDNSSKSKCSRIFITSNVADLTNMKIDKNSLVLKIPYNEGESFNRDHSESSFLIAFMTIIKNIIKINDILLTNLKKQDNN